MPFCPAIWYTGLADLFKEPLAQLLAFFDGWQRRPEEERLPENVTPRCSLRDVCEFLVLERLCQSHNDGALRCA